jgi:acetyl-CoA acyltransferase
MGAATMSRAVIAGYARTPFHFARKGKLAAVRTDDLAAIALRGLVTRLGLEPALVEDVLMGCAYPEGEQGTNVARIATLLAGFPDTVAGATINRFCGSSMAAVHYAAGQIAIGAGEAFICAGVESMTRVPQGGFSFSANPRFRGPNTAVAEFPTEAYVSMGQTAENVAARYGISRIAQETFALASQGKAAAAVAGGRLSAELVPVEIPDGNRRLRRVPTTTDHACRAGGAQACVRRCGDGRHRVSADRRCCGGSDLL